MLAQVEPAWVSEALGPLGLLVFLLGPVIWGGIKRWWVFGWVYREALEREEAAIRDRDYYRDAMFKALSTAEQSSRVVEKVVTP